MSTVNGLNSNSSIYSPAAYTYQNESTLLQDSGMVVSAPTSQLDGLAALSGEFDQLDQGINSQDAASYEPTQIQDPVAQYKNTYGPGMFNYTAGLSLLQNSGIQDANTDAAQLPDLITPMSNELNLLNAGINESEIPALNGLSGQLQNTSPDMAALGEELSLLNEGVDINDLQAISGGTVQNSNLIAGTNTLNYSYSPSTGISTTPLTDNSGGTNMDLQL